MFAPPFNVSAVQLGPTTVRFKFLDAQSKESGYEIQRSVNGGAFSTIGIVSTSGAGSGNLFFDDINVLFGMQLTYRGRAIGRNPSGPSAWSTSNTVVVH